MPKSGPIIIVEDDHDDQELLKELFADLKVPNLLRFFSTAVSALEYLITTIEKPFVIISDINLPAMSGLDFLRSINDNPVLRMKCIPFVFFTTASNNTVIQNAYLMSADGYFVKPLTTEELKKTIAAILTYWKIASAPI